MSNPIDASMLRIFFRPKATKWKKRRNYIRNTGRAGPLSAHIKK
jgi:hypothetical protein